MQITDLVFIDSTGYHVADFPAFLTWIQGQYQGIYGADVVITPDSQDGQFLSILAQAFFDTAALGASVYNSFNPIDAQGTGLSRLVKINGLNRQVPSFSTATVTVVGTAGTVITNGVAQDTLQQKWNLPATVTIPDAGTINVTATAQVVGQVFAEANTITSIFTPTRGWQTVNNAGAATPGAAVESDAELRVRQSISTADPSLTVLDGTVGGVANLPGVTKVRGYENDTNSTDGHGFPPHSIVIVVAGGTPEDICQEIALHKTPGTTTAGDSFRTVYDAHGMPLVIFYDSAVPASIQAQITISAGIAWSSDYEALIQQSVADYINAGLIGEDVLLSKIYGPAYLQGTAPGQTYDISGIELGKNGGGLSAANVSIDSNGYPTCDPTVDVTVIVT